MATALKILDARGNPIPLALPAGAPPRRTVRGRYDAAQLSPETRAHWAEADGLSARAANSPEVRRRLRTRARYEVANNSYARGIVETLANDTVGTGPRLQLLTPDPEENRAVERAFMAWSDAIGLPEKLRTMRKARAEDGEAFGLLTTNPGVDSPVQLDLRLVEADQVATPFADPFDPRAVDGIAFDRHGNPAEYHVLPYHPGDLIGYAPFTDYDRVPARLVLHWFRADRPGQVRGVPDITPALPLFAQLRRYTLAVIAAAETAADFAAVLYSELPPDSGAAVEAEPFEALEIERRMMTTLPAGWKMGQFRAEQPATTYKEFKGEILNEIARCLNMPFNVAAGNSSGYNYSSGRLDHQTYYKSLKVDRDQAERVVLDRVFRAWLEEAWLATGLLSEPPDRLAGWPHQWFWDGHEHVDPQKEAAAQETRLKNRTTTYAQEYARQGKDWEVELRQVAREQALMVALGIAPAPPAGAPSPAPRPVTQPDGGTDDGDPSED